MIEELAPGIRGDGCLDNFCADLDAIAGLRNARAQLVVVGQVINDRQQAADFFECLTSYCEGRAEPVMQPAFDQLREQDAGHELRSDSQRFKLRRKSRRQSAAM